MAAQLGWTPSPRVHGMLHCFVAGDRVWLTWQEWGDLDGVALSGRGRAGPIQGVVIMVAEIQIENNQNMCSLKS